MSEWQLANYVTSLNGIADPAARLRYTSWNMSEIFATNFGGYPLQPDTVAVSGPTYSHGGVLREGSARHVHVVQAPNGPALGLITFTGADGAVVSATMAPRFAVTRIR